MQKCYGAYRMSRVVHRLTGAPMIAPTISTVLQNSFKTKTLGTCILFSFKIWFWAPFRVRLGAQARDKWGPPMRTPLHISENKVQLLAISIRTLRRQEAWCGVLIKQSPGVPLLEFRGYQIFADFTPGCGWRRSIQAHAKMRLPVADQGQNLTRRAER